MKTKRIAKLALLACVLLLTAHAAPAFYNPQSGRWLSRDPIEEKGGLLLYAFINNNPVNGYDADGRVGQIVGGAIVGCAVNAGWSLFTSFLSGDNACQCTCKAFGSCGVGAIAGAIAAANPAWSRCMIGLASGVSSKFVGDVCTKACGKGDGGKPICSLISGVAQAIMGCAMPGSGDVSAVERTLMEIIVKVGGSDLKQFCNIVQP